MTGFFLLNCMALTMVENKVFCFVLASEVPLVSWLIAFQHCLMGEHSKKRCSVVLVPSPHREQIPVETRHLCTLLFVQSPWLMILHARSLMFPRTHPHQSCLQYLFQYSRVPFFVHLWLSLEQSVILSSRCFVQMQLGWDQPTECLPPPSHCYRPLLVVKEQRPMDSSREIIRKNS